MSDKINLGFAIGLPPEKAIEYFKSKGNTLSWDWHEVWQETHSKVFTVAKVTKMDILTDIRDMVQKSIDEGVTFQQFKKELEPKLKSKGWWGVVKDEEGNEIQLGSPWRLRTIYHTNLNTAYSSGRYKQMMDNIESRPYWQYWAVMDSRTRDEHAALNDKVFPYDDPFWDSFYPPNGFNCRCKVRALSERNIQREGFNIESSEGLLGTQKKLVSKKSGKWEEVTTYDTGVRDPSTGKSIKISPNVGWNYSPGKTSWEPDLSNYPDDLAAYFNKDNPKDLQQTQKLIFKNIPDWQEIPENPTKEEVTKAYNNTVLLENKFTEKWKEKFKRNVNEKILNAETDEEFFNTYEQNTKKKLDDKSQGYCIIDKVIGIRPEEVTKAGQGDLSACYTINHEISHSIGRNNFEGDEFKEEIVAGLNTALFMVENIEGAEPELIKDFLPRGSADISLNLILLYNGNKEKVIKNIKQLRILHPLVAKAYTRKFKELSNKEFASSLKELKGFNILPDDEIDNYLEKDKEERLDTRGKILLWILKKN